HVELTVGDLAPLLLDVPLELLPVAFDAVPVHVVVLACGSEVCARRRAPSVRWHTVGPTWTWTRKRAEAHTRSMSLPKPSENDLLRALSAAELKRLRPHLEPFPMPLGHVVYESGRILDHVYF